MKRLLTVLFMVFCFLTVIPVLFAQEDQEQLNQERLQQDISRIKSQEVVVQVLAAQYNKELAELRRMEAIFCDVYKLDIDIWRKGQYRWNNEKGKFVVAEEAKSAADSASDAGAQEIIIAE